MLRLILRVIPHAKKTLVREEREECLKVYVTAPAEAGKANRALIEALAAHFGVKKAPGKDSPG